MLGRICLLLLGILGASFAFDPASYENHQQILPQYEVYWNVNEIDSSILLALRVQTTGWVGFGIAEITSGSMPGADIVMGYVDNGVGTITDRWASKFALPAVDDCQDWKLVSSSEIDGYTILEVQRALDTKDSQDRAIVSGPNRIVVAFGEEDDLKYHAKNRVTSEITFYGESVVPALPSDTMFIDLRMPNFTVPQGFTSYICMSFSLPIDKEYSVIQIDPLVDERNVDRVHHFIGMICENVTGGSIPLFKEPGSCFSNLGDPNSGCNGIMSAWAAGGGSTVLPDDVGFAMGPGPTSIKFIVLDLHYNNHDGIGGYVDTSGIRIWYTDRVRKYEAGMLKLGDTRIALPSIPALTVKEYESECPSACTQKLSQDLIIWQSFPHMHEQGSQIWTTLWRDNEKVAEIGRIEYWSPDHQQTQLVNITVRPGDRLNTHCIYDTRKKNVVTNFGYNATDEMCLHFIGYYPRTPQTPINCGYAKPNYTVCNTAFMEYNNPTILDPKEGANRTFGLSNAKEICPQPENNQAAQTHLNTFVLFCSIFALFVTC